jgi:hypothetical protein
MNSVLINELDRVILNCQQATRNMESFLSNSPSEVDDVSSSEILQAKDNIGDDSTAESFLKIDPALTSTTDYLVYSRAIDELPTDGGGVMGAGAEVLCDDVSIKEAATDKGAIKRLHISRIYPLKKMELLKNQLEREELLKSTPEYYEYTKSQEELLNLFDEIGLMKAEKSVKSVQKASHFPSLRLSINDPYPVP